MSWIEERISLKNKPSLVIHVVTSLDYGGVERHMEVIASVFEQARMRHLFVAIGRGGATEVKLRAMGAEVICLGENPSIPSFGAFIALWRLFSRERPLAIHTHGAEANFHGLLAARLARVPVRIGEEIGMPGHSAKAKLVFRFVYGTAHRVIGVSRVVTQWLTDSGEVPFAKALRVDNPVQLPAMGLEEGFKKSSIRFIFVGRLEPVKNPSDVLTGFAKLLRQVNDAELWFIGDGSERSALENEAIHMGLGDKVTFFGFQKNPELYICQCHVLVQPSLSEGFSLGLVEAMACGVPVISTAVGSAPEIIQQGTTGWLLPKPDSILIAGALKEAWGLGPDKLREMGLKARKSVEGRFKPIHYLERIEALYEQLASKKGDE